MSKSRRRQHKKHKQKGHGKKFRIVRNKRAQRRADMGRQFELTVSLILSKMVEENKLTSFLYNQPNSLADQQGKDFTVVRAGKDGEEITHSFGVTISQRSWGRSKLKHPDVPQFFFPIGTPTRTIKEKILELFMD